MFTLREIRDLYYACIIICAHIFDDNIYDHRDVIIYDIDTNTHDIKIAIRKFIRGLLDRITIVMSDRTQIVFAALSRDTKLIDYDPKLDIKLDSKLSIEMNIHMIKYDTTMTPPYKIIIYNDFYNHNLLRSYRDKSKQTNIGARFIISVRHELRYNTKSIIVDYPTIRDIIYISYILRDDKSTKLNHISCEELIDRNP